MKKLLLIVLLLISPSIVLSDSNFWSIDKNDSPTHILVYSKHVISNNMKEDNKVGLAIDIYFVHPSEFRKNPSLSNHFLMTYMSSHGTRLKNLKIDDNLYITINEVEYPVRINHKELTPTVNLAVLEFTNKSDIIRVFQTLLNLNTVSIKILKEEFDFPTKGFEDKIQMLEDSLKM